MGQGRNLLRFLSVFLGIAAIGFGLLEAPFSRAAVDTFTGKLVEISALVVRICGGQAAAQRNLLRNPVTGFAITVADTCNASNVVIRSAPPFWPSLPARAGRPGGSFRAPCCFTP